MLLDAQRKNGPFRPMLLPYGNVYSLLFTSKRTVAGLNFFFFKLVRGFFFLFEALQPALLLPSAVVFLVSASF